MSAPKAMYGKFCEGLALWNRSDGIHLAEDALGIIFGLEFL